MRSERISFITVRRPRIVHANIEARLMRLYELGNTGVGPFDTILNILVTFFKYGLIPGTAARTFHTAFWASVASWIAIMELEAVRVGAGRWLRLTICTSHTTATLLSAYILLLFFSLGIHLPNRWRGHHCTDLLRRLPQQIP